jgi:spermidine synthase
MMNTRVRLLYALFAVSGFCGLIYESIWSHYLKQFVGHAAYAQTLVLAVFMGGMGLGAWLTARYTHRIRNLLWGYAAVELVIGATAIGFHRVFGSATEWAYATMLPAACAGEGFCLAQWAFAAAFILPQSILLGSTFPLMSGGILRLAPDLPGSRVAALYFLNSIGAVAGVLASGFLLIPTIGLPGAIMTAGIGNILLAVSVYFIAKPRYEEEGRPTSSALASAARSPELMVLLMISALTGLSSFVYEVSWIRMLSMVLGSATHSFEIMLAAFILGLALGGLWIRSRIDKIKNVIQFLAVVQILMGICALLTLPLYNQTFDLMSALQAALSRNESGYVLFNVTLTFIALAVMLPTTFCAGMTLPLITYYLFNSGSGERAIGQVYAANTIGAILGVLLTVHLLMPYLGLRNAMVFGAAIDILLGLYLLLPQYRQGLAVPRWIQVAAATGLLFVVIAPFLFHFDAARMASSVFRHGGARIADNATVTFARDGKAATVHVVKHADERLSLSTNGKVDGGVQLSPSRPAADDEATMTLLGTLPIVYRPNAKEIAVIGFGTGMSSTAVLAATGPTRVSTIEIEPAIVEAARQFAPMNALAFSDPRHAIVYDDAKSYFARGNRQYDVIVSEPSNPWVGGVAGLFTVEFYARLKRFLKEDGILVQWLHIYEITPELVATIANALATHFPYFELYQGSSGDLILVAAPHKPVGQPTLQWLGMPEVKKMMARVGFESAEDLAANRIASHQMVIPVLETYSTLKNSDFFPIVDHLGPKARFMNANATFLAELRAFDVPIVWMLDGETGNTLRREVLQNPANMSLHVRQIQANRIMQKLSGISGPHWPQLIPVDFQFLVEHVDKLIWQCKSSGSGSLDLLALQRIAAATIPHLSKADAISLWSSFGRSRCMSELPAITQSWIRLHEAVALRDAGRITEQAEFLLARTTEVALVRHLVQATATAQLMNDRAADALATLEKGLQMLPPTERNAVWIRLLSSLAVDVRAGRRSFAAVNPQ